MKITRLEWCDIADMNFYRIFYEVDNFAWHNLNLSKGHLDGLDMSIPDAVAYLLRAELDCVPKENLRDSR